jgi:hypothetical protein
LRTPVESKPGDSVHVRDTGFEEHISTDALTDCREVRRLFQDRTSLKDTLVMAMIARADSAFTLSALPPGKYKLTVDAEGLGASAHRQLN